MKKKRSKRKLYFLPYFCILLLIERSIVATTAHFKVIQISPSVNNLNIFVIKNFLKDFKTFFMYEKHLQLRY